MRRLLIAAALGLVLGGVALAGEVVVLAGGERIELKSPPLRQGNRVLLTRSDGTLFSVPSSEIDWKATAAARSAAPVKPAPAIAAVPEGPAEAARLSRDGPKAKIRITDADVEHVVELPAATAEGQAKEPGTGQTGPHVEVADYTQEKAGSNLVVRGEVRNVGTASALNLRMAVTALDEKQQRIGSADATVSNGVVESGRSVAFSASIPVGEKTPASVRFAPRWIEPPPPAPARPASTAAAPSTPAAGASEAAGGASSPPAPAPTPYGRGLYYAPAAPPAPSSPPADGKTGYIPGAARKEDQPKPPQ